MSDTPAPMSADDDCPLCGGVGELQAYTLRAPGGIGEDVGCPACIEREMQAALDEKDAEIARLREERDQAALATHRQAFCIHQCAGHIGPETAATVDGLPKAVAALAARASRAEREIDEAVRRLAEVEAQNAKLRTDLDWYRERLAKGGSDAARAPDGER